MSIQICNNQVGWTETCRYKPEYYIVFTVVWRDSSKYCAIWCMAKRGSDFNLQPILCAPRGKTIASYYIWYLILSLLTYYKKHSSKIHALYSIFHDFYFLLWIQTFDINVTLMAWNTSIYRKHCYCNFMLLLHPYMLGRTIYLSLTAWSHDTIYTRNYYYGWTDDCKHLTHTILHKCTSIHTIHTIL